MQQIITITLYLLTILIPLVFTPGTSELFEFPKFLILISGTLTITYTGGWSTHTFTVTAGEYVQSTPPRSGGGALLGPSPTTQVTVHTTSTSSASTSTQATSTPAQHTTSTPARCTSATGDMTLVSFVNLLIALGIIHEDKVATACTALSTPTPTHPSFTRTLTLGDTGEDVRRLQQFLNARGFTVATQGDGSLGHETMFFGIQTKNALKRFQEAYRADILTPSGLTAPTGYFGPNTMNKVHALLMEG
jgi:hypothetical protein